MNGIVGIRFTSIDHVLIVFDLVFKGTIEQLKSSVFILNCYGKPFFPQFRLFRRRCLQVVVIGYGEMEETNPFEASISFFYNGKWNPNAKDIVFPMGMDKKYFISEALGLPFNIVTLQRSCYDVQLKEYKFQEEIEFEMRIICEKLDEVAKDKNVESGVEETDNEDE